MTIDLNGLGPIIAATCTGIALLATTATTIYLQIKAARLAETNKKASIAAREAQTKTIIASAVVPALNTPPPTPDGPVLTKADADRVAQAMNKGEAG